MSMFYLGESGTLAASAGLLEFEVVYHVTAVTVPFAVLLRRGLLYSDFTLSDELFKPVFTSDELCGYRFAEHHSMLVEYEGNEFEPVLRRAFQSSDFVKCHAVRLVVRG